MYYAISAYGWPMYLITHSKTGICDLCSNLKCCNVFCSSRSDNAKVIEDNCCLCNYAALKQMMSDGDVEIIYVTYHVDIGETPFFVAIDYAREKIVVSIRGTLSMKDVLTDLNAEGEPLPLNPTREDFLGHKGMVQAAVYIKNKLYEENLIEKALNHNPSRGSQNYGLVLVGHSLGAGTAAILAILLKQDFANLQCFSYSPPGNYNYNNNDNDNFFNIPTQVVYSQCPLLNTVRILSHQLWLERMQCHVSAFIKWNLFVLIL